MPDTKTGHVFYQTSLQKLLHFTCGNCSNKWSLDVTEKVAPEQVYCPWCGDKNLNQLR